MKETEEKRIIELDIEVREMTKVIESLKTALQ
jgi:hypothetical protein